jgi:hypothetical protein
MGSSYVMIPFVVVCRFSVRASWEMGDLLLEKRKNWFGSATNGRDDTSSYATNYRRKDPINYRTVDIIEPVLV